jgi:sodium/hydrogen antiporter
VHSYGLVMIAAFVFAYALLARRLSTTFLTGPILFMAFGILLGPQCLEVLNTTTDIRPIKILMEATLVLVLFSDAMAINAKSWRKEVYVPERLLGIGLPLTILLGFIAALVFFHQLDVWEAALVGAILAPTDAALGLAVISNERVPRSIRHGLNVESGLNDGLVLPIVMVLIAATAGAEGMETTSHVLWFIVKTVLISGVVGVAVGCIGGWLTSRVARRKSLDGVWGQITVPALAALAYGMVLPFGGSGFISAWVAGFTFGLLVKERVSELSELTDALGQLLVMLSFLLFGGVVLSPLLGNVTWEVVLYAILSLTVVRIAPVAVSMVRSGMKPPSVLYMGWFGPRGLASIVFAFVIVEEAQLPGQTLIVTIMAVTVGISILAHGLTALWGSNRYADWYAGQSAEHSRMLESHSVSEFPARGRLGHSHPGHAAQE